MSDVYASRAFMPHNLPALSEADAEGAGYCQQQCKAGTANCLPLSSEYAALTLPVRQLLDAANENERPVITRAEFMESYGLPDDADRCERGDVHISTKHVTNQGPRECTIPSVAAASLFARNVPATSRTSLLSEDPDLSLHMKSKITATRAPADLFSAPGLGRGIIFEDAEESMALTFKASPLGLVSRSEVDDYNNRFAGYIRDATYYRDEDGVRSVALSTPRGCVSFDAP